MRFSGIETVSSFEVQGETRASNERSRARRRARVSEIPCLGIRSVWLLQKRGVMSATTTKTAKLAVANGSPIRVEEEAMLE